jgi:hypothetical protein
MGPRKRKTDSETRETETVPESIPAENAPPVKKIRSDGNEEKIKVKEEVEDKLVPKEEMNEEVDVINEKEKEVKKEKLAPKEEKDTEEKNDNEDMEEEEEECHVSKKRRSGRKRMKKVYCDIRQQMEFYFSDANIAKSSFMQVNVYDIVI